MFIQIARCFIFEVYCDEEIFLESTRAFMTHFFALMFRTVYSHLLISQEKFQEVRACQSIIDHESLSHNETIRNLMYYSITFIINCLKLNVAKYIKHYHRKFRILLYLLIDFQ